MTVRAVVFDVGGVLALVEPMDFDARWEAKLGLERGTIGAAMADVWEAGAIGGVTEAEVHQALSERLGLDAEEVMADMWEQYLGRPNTALIAFVRGLRPACRTGILSNSFVGAREREQQRYGLSDLVDEVIYSHEEGMNKPDPRLWELTCRRLGSAPDETVFVDDSPALVRSARAYGMHAVLFQDTAQTIREVEALLSTRRRLGL
ncbi:HAD family phosphatase [Actinoplanes sp. OR16]|uniref:HAD family hydrolase n=1 Tax=Actinoplanes sp. OR16 TaxID=946334 RepID=UPI0018D5879B|nr:HAD family phosphatase [Actinoplanes sp. OR16]